VKRLIVVSVGQITVVIKKEYMDQFEFMVAEIMRVSQCISPNQSQQASEVWVEEVLLQGYNIICQ